MTPTPAPAAPAPLSAADLLARVRTERVERDACEVRILLLGLEWAHRHVVAPPQPDPPQVSHLEDAPRQSLETFERLGLPELSWDAGASFAAALGLSTAAGDRLLRDALILSVRLPRVWDRVLAGQVPVWRARRICEAAVGAPLDVATHLDQHTAPVAEKIGVTGLDRLIDAAMLLCYPEEREIAQLEALDARHVTLHEETLNHTGIAELTARGDWADLSAFEATLAEVAAVLGGAGHDGQHETLDVRRSMALGVLADPARAQALLDAPQDTVPTRPVGRRRRTVRFVAHLSEANLLGLDPMTLDSTGRGFLTETFTRWAGRPDLAVHLQPVLHCGGCPDCDHQAGHTSQDTYRPTSAEATVVRLRDRTCQFPYCTREATSCDLDHRDPFDHDHPEAGGPTCPCNLAPLCRRHHRLKTHAGWTYTSVEPGVHLWRDRYDQIFLRTRDGTTDLTERTRKRDHPT